MSEIATVSDELFEELQKVYENKPASTFDIIERLRREFDVNPETHLERLLLYGRRRDHRLVEDLIGYLVAVVPGIVVFDTHRDQLLRPLTGLLERLKPSDTQLFGLRPLTYHNVSLYIWPSTFPEDRRRYELCPVWASWQIGAGHGEAYGASGIDPARWEIMKEWFDKWLPPR